MFTLRCEWGYSLPYPTRTICRRERTYARSIMWQPCWPYSMSMGLKDVRKLWPTVSFKNSTNDNGSLLRNLHAKNQLLWYIDEVHNKIEGSCLSPTFFRVIIWTLLRVSTNEIGPWLDDKILMQKCHIAINDNQFLYFFKKKFDWYYLHKILYKADNGILECVSVAWYNSTSFYHAIVSF